LLARWEGEVRVKIARFVLIDINFPQLNKPTKSHHINPEHLTRSLFPFELTYRKYDLKVTCVSCRCCPGSVLVGAARFFIS